MNNQLNTQTAEELKQLNKLPIDEQFKAEKTFSYYMGNCPNLVGNAGLIQFYMDSRSGEMVINLCPLDKFDYLMIEAFFNLVIGKGLKVMLYNPDFTSKTIELKPQTAKKITQY